MARLVPKYGKDYVSSSISFAERTTRMLDTDTKRRIDTARDILVGKVPRPPRARSRQITIALIYKFMDDMDLEAEEIGGKRSFLNDFTPATAGPSCWRRPRRP